MEASKQTEQPPAEEASEGLALPFDEMRAMAAKFRQQASEAARQGHKGGAAAVNLGRIAGALERADEALFDVANTASSFLSNPDASDACERWHRG